MSSFSRPSCSPTELFKSQLTVFRLIFCKRSQFNSDHSVVKKNSDFIYYLVILKTILQYWNNCRRPGHIKSLSEKRDHAVRMRSEFFYLLATLFACAVELSCWLHSSFGEESVSLNSISLKIYHDKKKELKNNPGQTKTLLCISQLIVNFICILSEVRMSIDV